MGDFIGHFFPGFFFFFFALWWATNVFRRHFRCRQRKEPFYSAITFPVSCCPVRRMRKAPVEAIFKIVLGVVLVVGELRKGPGHLGMINAQHSTMFFFYGLTGVFDLLVLKDLAPAGTDYVALMMALMVEGVLMKFHLYGRDQLDILLHTLLLYVIAATVTVLGLETKFRNTALLPLLRCLLFMVHGTWLVMVAFLLYHPFHHSAPWNPKDHKTLMLAVVCFCWHLAANLTLLLLVGVVTGFCCNKNKKARYSQLRNVVALNVLGKEEEKGGGEEEESLLGNGMESRDVKGDGPRQNGIVSFLENDGLSDVEFEAQLAK